MSEAMREYEHGENVLAAGGAMVQSKTSHITAVAVQRPRDLRRAVGILETEAELSGELFYYGWGEGKNRVEGPSVKLALAALRAYTNASIEARPVDETPDAFVFTHVFVDVENGTEIPRQFRQSKKWTVFGKMDEERKMDVRFQIGQSKNIRNVILHAIPAVMINKAMDAAKKGVRKKILEFIAQHDEKNPGSGLIKAREMVLSPLLSKWGVNAERVCQKFGVAESKAIGVDEIIIIRGDIEAITNGEAKADELYPHAPNPTTTDLKDKIKNAKPGGPVAGEGEPAKRSTGEADAEPAKRSASGRKPKPAAEPLAEGEIPNEDFGKSRDRQREPGEDDELTEGL